MALTSLLTARDAVQVAALALGEASTSVAEVARAGTSSDRDLRHVVAEIDGARADVRGVRRDLDVTDVSALVKGADAGAKLQAWLWERGLRRQAIAVERRAAQAQALAERLLEGWDEVTHVVRSGETLQAIAQKRLGDWKEWRRLATYNAVQPADLTAGTVLRIPPKR